MNAKKLTEQVIQEGAENSFKYKGNVIVIEAGLDKEKSRQYAAEVFKALRKVIPLQDKKYSITLEIQEVEKPQEPEVPETKSELGENNLRNGKKTNFPNIFVGWGVSGRNNGTAIIRAQNAQEAGKILQDEWLDNGKIAKITTFEQYVEMAGLGSLDYPEDVESEVESLKADKIWPSDQIGSWNEIEWGS